MGNSDIKSTNELLIKVDHNNLIYIDPNTVIDNGVLKPRMVELENLVMYVNLEADLIPRTTLIANDLKSTIRSIASGTINFMKNADGSDYDTRWTESFISNNQRTTTLTNIGGPEATYGRINTYFPEVKEGKGIDPTAQTFGIDNISIKVMGANFIPRVDIRFIDVRGKTLFETPQDSPYAAFFHIPWPIFYLTVKGYYGKAIKYRLHLIKFNSRYDSINGNFEIDCNFVGSTYAYLADIGLQTILNAPYFYFSETSEDIKYNELTGLYEKEIKRTTKGYRVLKSVYQEYISKGYLPKDFPIKTLREIIVLAGRLNKIMEKKLFDEFVDYRTLAAVKEYENDIIEFIKKINAWDISNLSQTSFMNVIPATRLDPILNEEELIRWKYFLASSSNQKDQLDSLGKILKEYTKRLENNFAFGIDASSNNKENKKYKTQTISCASVKNVKDFYIEQDGKIGVNTHFIIDEINKMLVNFIEQRNKLETDIETLMNEIIKGSKDTGLGFKPTIRNVIAIVLANAETYIRLMKDVHERAFENARQRKKILDEQSIITDGGDTIYPWPEIKLGTHGDRENVVIYPGSKQMEMKLKSWDSNLWPEVEFVENFYMVSTKIKDNLAGKEGTPDNVHFVYGSEDIDIIVKDTSVFSNVLNTIPYTDKSISNILYEMYERAKVTTMLSPFSTDAIHELADVEYSNLENQIMWDVDVINTLKKQVSNYDDLIKQMSTITNKYQYYLDQLPSTGYIQNGLTNDFSMESFRTDLNTKSSNGDYTKVNNFLKNYKAEQYRNKLYPFNSPIYKSYNKNDLNLNGMIQVNTPFAFISSPIDSAMWIKDGFTSNMFMNTIDIDGHKKHILNTPYFHWQLYNDFIKLESTGKYAGSAYLLLNSLPYKDLDDTIVYKSETWQSNPGTPTVMSTMFRELGSTHFIPYYLILKWGSIYHRYKKYINDGVDIINGIINRIESNLFFDNKQGVTFTGLYGGKSISESTTSDIGFHPYYETIFHQIVNGYGFYNIDLPDNSYSNAVSNGTIRSCSGVAVGANTWSTVIDESKFDSNDQRYVLLPTNGMNPVDATDFILAEQENFRVIWGVGTDFVIGDTNIDYTRYSFPNYKEYIRTIKNEFSISSNYKKIIDLIATFKPDILDVFESAFLNFCSEKLNENISYTPYKVSYTRFQDLLNAIVSVKKENTDETNNVELLKSLKIKQLNKLSDITAQLQMKDNLIKLSISNPREHDDYLFGGFTGVNVKHFSLNSYNIGQILTNLGNIELYLGEDMDGYYQDFFRVNNIELNEENIKQFRPLIYMYAGLRAEGENPSHDEFINYVNNNIINPPSTLGVKPPAQRLNNYLTYLIHKIQHNLNGDVIEERSSSILRGHNDEQTLKLETYNYFKSFNDKWIAGNSIGQRLLIEEFLFLDRANKDIGQKVFIDLSKFIRLGLSENAGINLYSAISLLIQDTGFDIRALPAYVNFYGTSATSALRITPSRDIARSMFGSFLDVDYQEATPKIILQYIGPTSKHPEMSDIINKNKNYLFNNDGFDIGDTNNNPIIVSDDIFASTDFTKSNKVVAFEVSFGDQNQSIFKGLELDQSTIRNTSESFYVYEQLGRSEGGTSTAQVDIGLWNIYRQASYQCTVTSMGNVMIQPTMYFYLKNVPMFRGSYWITEVTHNIRSTGIETMFKGTRIPQLALPKPEDSFMASYRPLFDKVIKEAVRIVKEGHNLTETTKTQQTITNNGVNTYDLHGKLLPGETMVEKHGGYEPYGIPFNGAGNQPEITKIEYNKKTWLRARVVEMDSPKYKIPPDRSMSIASGTRLSGNVKWSDIYDSLKSNYIYETKFDLNKIPRSKDGFIILTDSAGYINTEFLNPKNNKYFRMVNFLNGP